jgi:hypothetical protein
MQLLRKRKFWLAAGLIIASALGGAAYALPPWPSLLNLFFDFVGFSLALLGGLALISQFILPVQSHRERRKVFDHFMNFVSGQAGPVLFVRDGQLVGGKDELRRYGHGVALVDTVSAVVLEQSAAHSWWSRPDAEGQGSRAPRPQADGPPLVRAAGPGIVFIRPGERIVKTLDLRRHSRGMSVEALTGDGIECSAYISVTFGLDPDPERQRAKQPPAGERIMPTDPFNPHSAFRAVYGMALGDKQPIEWTDLPLMVAAECFRIVLAEYCLDDLFEPTRPKFYPFNKLRERINATIKGAPVLAERGLVVYNVAVPDLKLPREVVNQRVRLWQAHWQKVTIDREAAVETQAIATFRHRQAKAQTQLIHDLQKLMDGNPDPVARDALWRMLAKALQRVANDPVTRQKLPPDTLRALDSLGEAP